VSHFRTCLFRTRLFQTGILRPFLGSLFRGPHPDALRIQRRVIGRTDGVPLSQRRRATAPVLANDTPAASGAAAGSSSAEPDTPPTCAVMAEGAVAAANVVRRVQLADQIVLGRRGPGSGVQFEHVDVGLAVPPWRLPRVGREPSLDVRRRAYIEDAPGFFARHIDEPRRHYPSPDPHPRIGEHPLESNPSALKAAAGLSARGVPEARRQETGPDGEDWPAETEMKGETRPRTLWKASQRRRAEATGKRSQDRTRSQEGDDRKQTGQPNVAGNGGDRRDRTGR
jgi:hypothetical protein